MNLAPEFGFMFIFFVVKFYLWLQMKKKYYAEDIAAYLYGAEQMWIM